MSKIYRGSATRLILDNSPITGETRCSVSLTLRTHKVASFSAPDWEHLLPELSTWSADAEGKLNDATAAILAHYLIEPALVPVSFTIGDTILSGHAIPTSVSLKGSVSGSATWSLSLKGSGPLIIV